MVTRIEIPCRGRVSFCGKVRVLLSVEGIDSLSRVSPYHPRKYFFYTFGVSTGVGEAVLRKRSVRSFVSVGV
jgi:hypothetical protein